MICFIKSRKTARPIIQRKSVETLTFLGFFRTAKGLTPGPYRGRDASPGLGPVLDLSPSCRSPRIEIPEQATDLSTPKDPEKDRTRFIPPEPADSAQDLSMSGSKAAAKAAESHRWAQKPLSIEYIYSHVFLMTELILPKEPWMETQKRIMNTVNKPQWVKIGNYW